MSREENTQIVDRFFNALKQTNLEALNDLVAPDLSVHIPLPGDTSPGDRASDHSPCTHAAAAAGARSVGLTRTTRRG
jgi:ketosteroid isomerase-like protein